VLSDSSQYTHTAKENSIRMPKKQITTVIVYLNILYMQVTVCAIYNNAIVCPQNVCTKESRHFRCWQQQTNTSL